MSRVGMKPIPIKDNVEVKLDGDSVTIKGQKGELTVHVLPGIDVKVDDNEVTVTRKDDKQSSRGYHGLIRTLIENAITGVSDGFSKKLVIEGVGYRGNVQGNKLVLELGFSHDIKYDIPENISVSVDGNTITVEGFNKQQVGRVASEIRAFRKPEPYKGKGIRFEGEKIRRKVGKAAATGGAA